MKNQPSNETETRADVGCTDLVRCVVTKQGGPILNEGYVVAAGESVAAIEIDMRSKRCEVMAESATEDGAPVIWLDGENALHLKKGHEKEQTEVAFPDYKGWRIFSSHVCRYTFRVCFVRDEAPNADIRRAQPDVGTTESLNMKPKQSKTASAHKRRLHGVVGVRCVFLDMNGKQCHRKSVNTRRFFGDPEIHGDMWAQVPCCYLHDRDARD